jgi:hypothetical protein
MSAESLDETPRHAGVIESPNWIWDWYRGKASVPAPRMVDLALAQHENWIYIVVLGTTPGEAQDLYEAVFLPAIKSLTPVALDTEYALQLEAHAEEYRQMIRTNRVHRHAAGIDPYGHLSDHCPAEGIHQRYSVGIGIDKLEGSSFCKEIHWLASLVYR